jgi:hypothetical protein
VQLQPEWSGSPDGPGRDVGAVSGGGRRRKALHEPHHRTRIYLTRTPNVPDICPLRQGVASAMPGLASIRPEISRRIASINRRSPGFGSLSLISEEILRADMADPLFGTAQNFPILKQIIHAG